jgi:hypothetical protein
MSGPASDADIERLLARRRALESGRSATPAVSARLRALRAWQARRLARTYEDLRSDPRYTAAVEFFLNDLYGPQDFSRRDQELSRAVVPLRRALPASLLAVLTRAIELDVLTVELDQRMIGQLRDRPLTEASYAMAYRALGEAEARRRQIDLTVSIGAALERLVRHRWIGLALRAAHRPARAAGFGVLQQFLERGFAAFLHMGNARPLLAAIRQRETALMDRLLCGDDAAAAASLLTTEPAVHA